MNVYKLTADTNYRSVMDMNNAWGHTLRWFRGGTHEASWVPLPLVLNPHEAKLPHGDLFGFNNTLPILTERAVATLRDVIEKTGELLPLDCREEALYGFNVTSVLKDALDVEHTEAGRFSDGSLGHITKHAFHADAIRDVFVFRVKQQPAHIYATDKFVKIVEQAGLKGFTFKFVWSSDYEIAPHLSGTVSSVTKEPDVREEEIPADQIQVIKGASEEAAEYLRLTGQETAKEVVRYIASAVTHLREHPLVKDEESRHAAMLGALFGEQVVRTYGWSWAQVGDERMAYAVVAPDKSVYIEPLQYVWQLLLDKDKDSTVLLLFNMLADAQPNARSGAYWRVG